jgi:hypothetical protein
VTPEREVDVSVEIKHESPALFDLKMAHAPPGAVLQKGRFAWKPDGSTGSWRIEFTASRDGHAAVTESLEIHVARAGGREAAIELHSPGTIDAVTGAPTATSLKAQAKDGGHLLFESVRVPEGVSLNRYTGELSWAPRPNQAGPHRMRFRVRNGLAEREFDVLFRVRGASAPSPVSYCNQYIPQTFAVLDQLQKTPIVYRRIFETLRLLRDRYEPVYQKVLAEAKTMYREIEPKFHGNCLQELHLHAWQFADKPEILNWMREIAAAEKSEHARNLLERLAEIDRYNADRTSPT